MYLRTLEPSGPTSGLFPAILGDVPTARGKPPSAFEHVLYEHLDASTSSMVGGVVLATPSVLTTTFFDADVSGTVSDSALRRALTDLLSRNPAYARAKRSLAIALVDLSGPNKFAPRYAGFNDTATFSAASTSKVCGLLSAYQLAADVREFLRRNPAIRDVIDLESALKRQWNQQGILPRHHPLVAKILQFRNGSPPTVTLRRELTCRFDALSKGNENGSTAIVLLRFPFIGSTMLAHGLFSPANKGGLWVRKAYGAIRYLGNKMSLQNWSSSENPHPGTPSHSVNAVSIAQFFTLAAQGRIIDRPTSQAILGHLDIYKGGCATTLPDLKTLSASGFIAAKCGIYPLPPDVLHVPLYYKDSRSAREFVVVILTKNGKYGIVKNLFRDLIALVP